MAQRLLDRAVAVPRPGFGSEASLRWLTLVRTWWVPVAATLVALLLRTYNFALLSWVPDGYEQLDATKRLLALDFPLSRIYSPGVAVLMAPFLLVLPQTLEGLQYVIIGFGVALVPLAYIAMLRLTGNRMAATFLALALTFDSSFVYQSRDPHYDPIVTVLIGASIALVPWLRRRGFGTFVAYGAMLALVVNIRPVNIAVMPALLIYWAALEAESNGWLAAIRSLFDLRVVLTGVTLVALTIAGVVLGGWYGEASRAPMTLEKFPEHLVVYYTATFGGVLAVFVAPLAAIGAWRLWKTQRPLALALLFVVAVWPLVHAPFYWTGTRYMLPAHLCVWFFAATGAAELWRGVCAKTMSRTGKLLFAPSLAILALLLVVPSLLLLADWQRIAARSEEGMFSDLRPYVSRLDDGSMLISAVNRGVRDANGRLVYVDLIDYSIDHGVGPDAKAALATEVSQKLATGRDVYYLYTHWEDGQDFEGDGRRGFIAYYEAVRDNFALQLIERGEPSDWRSHAWTLYRVTSR